MFLRSIILTATLAMGFGAMSQAATCTVGSFCNVTGADGQLLSGQVDFDINAIEGDVNNDFTFETSFNNNTSGNARVVAAFLPSVSQGAITDLMLNIISPAGVAASYALVADVFTKINLVGSANEIIGFTLTGKAIQGTVGGRPDINISLLPAAVPLPAGVLLLGTALAGFGIARRRRKS